MYHGIDSLSYPYRGRSDEELEWVLPLSTFIAHMELLKLRGFRPVKLDELLKIEKIQRAPFKPIILTFDDGHESNYLNVLPVLKQFGYEAEFFITADWIGSDNYMNQSQLIEMHNSGMSIQSHACSHRFLTDLGDQEVFEELMQSKMKLSGILGDNIKYISYPGGRFNQKIEQIAQRVGYQGSYSANSGYNYNFKSLFGLKRQGLTKDTKESEFVAIIENTLLKYRIKNKVTKLLFN